MFSEGDHVEGLGDLLVLGGRIAGVLEAGCQAAATEKPGGDLELVAEVPGADLLAGGLADVVEAGVLPGHGPGARALEDLGDVDEVRTALAGLEDLGDPRDRELGAVGRRADLLRNDRRSAVEELDVQVLRVEVALLLGREVAGELRLRHPLELEADLRRSRALPLRRPNSPAPRWSRRAVAAAGVAGAGVAVEPEHAANSTAAADTSPRTRVCFLMLLLCCGAPPGGAPTSPPPRQSRGIGGTIQDWRAGRNGQRRPARDRVVRPRCAPSCATG